MKRLPKAQLAAAAIAGAFTFSGLAPAMAQQATVAPGAPRSTDERVVTGTPTPPPVNSDYRKAAEGQLPGVAAPAGGAVPNPNGAIDPAGRLAPNGLRLQTGDPAVRLQPPVMSAVAPAGMDVAMLIEHAIGMAIESSALQAIADQGSSSPNDASTMLLDHARKGMETSKALLTRAAADGRNIDAASPTRRLYAAANSYLGTLAALSAATAPADKAQVAMINHSVKEVLDSAHIRQFGRAYSSGAATEQMLGHAREMHDGGMQMILKMAGNGPVDPAAPASATLLAQKGRELVDAAEQLSGAPGAVGSRPGVSPAQLLSDEPNPGRLTDPNANIVGGTQATGSQTTGTATGPAAAKAVTNPNTIPNLGESTTRPTGGQAGPRPR